eukprot:2102640-Amphidinium_carterae.1
MMNEALPSTDVILKNANQALLQAKARQSQQQPLIKGSTEHKKSLLKTKPPTKPPSGFPKGTAVSKYLRWKNDISTCSSFQPYALGAVRGSKTCFEIITKHRSCPTKVPPPIDFRWHTPSAVISRQKCWFCEEEDQPDRPLNVDQEWHTRPSRSALKHFPDCLWCKSHKSIVLPVVKYKHRIGAREDWYFWDSVEAHSKTITTSLLSFHKSEK